MQRPELKVSWDKMADMGGRYFAFFRHSEIIVNETEINCQVLEGSLTENKEKAEFLSKKMDMSQENWYKLLTKRYIFMKLMDLNKYKRGTTEIKHLRQAKSKKDVPDK